MVPIPFNNLTSRADAAALIPEEVSRDMIRRATNTSAALTMFRRVPVSRAQVRFPVLSALPVAYFVNGDTGVKQTTEVNWTNKYLNIEEIAAIMPVPDNVIADVEVNIWDEAMPYLVEAFGRTLDAAVFFGTNAPGTWPTNVSAAALAAGNTQTASTVAASGGFYADLDTAIGQVEADGFDMNGIVASTEIRSKFRLARNSQGDRLDAGRVGNDLMSFDGSPVSYPMRGLWPTGANRTAGFLGDWSQFVLGVRSDISVKILDQAVITDNSNAIIFNLPQQDMTALRLTFRVGWQVANLLNYDQPTEGSRYPAARIVLP